MNSRKVHERKARLDDVTTPVGNSAGRSVPLQPVPLLIIEKGLLFRESPQIQILTLVKLKTCFFTGL